MDELYVLYARVECSLHQTLLNCGESHHKLAIYDPNYYRVERPPFVNLIEQTSRSSIPVADGLVW